MKLPAFGRELADKRRRGLSPVRDICIATEWDVGRSWPWRLVVPTNENPETLDFSVVAGLSCLLLGHDQSRMDDVARAVARFRPLRLVAVRLGGTTIDVHIAAPLEIEERAA